MNLVICVSVFLGVAWQVSGTRNSQSIPIGTPATHCANRVCPAYTVVSTHNNYEKRRYQPSVWLETTRKAGERRLVMFARLFNYMKGKNAKGKKITMNLPVVGHLRIDPTGGHTESMRFFLGQDTGSVDPPRPTDANVHIHHDPAMEYYVMGFNTAEWRDMNVWNAKAKVLKGLANVGHSEYCGASYGPRGPGQKYNEIWMHTSSSHSDHHYHHHEHNDSHDHHHGDHDHQHDNVHGHDHGGDHNH